MPIPLPMFARPLDMVAGPPDPRDQYRPMNPHSAIWLAPGGIANASLSNMALNPGEPGGPEHLPWKRSSSTVPDDVRGRRDVR